jgi:hypothetical protein
LGSVENMARNQTISLGEKEVRGNVEEELLKLQNALLVWEFKVMKCLEYMRFGISNLVQIGPFLNH